VFVIARRPFVLGSFERSVLFREFVRVAGILPENECRVTSLSSSESGSQGLA